MRKLFVFTVAFIFAFVLQAAAQVNFVFKGVGGHIGYVKPEDPIESTIGFGVRADLGTITKENITMGALIDYWKKSYGSGTSYEFSYSQILLAPFVHYNFVTGGAVTPYAGGGLALAINGVKTTANYPGYSGTTSSSDSDIMIFGVGGAKMKINEQFTGFAEARYALGDIDSFSIMAGVLFMLGK